MMEIIDALSWVILLAALAFSVFLVVVLVEVYQAAKEARQHFRRAHTEYLERIKARNA